MLNVDEVIDDVGVVVQALLVLVSLKWKYR